MRFADLARPFRDHPGAAAGAEEDSRVFFGRPERASARGASAAAAAPPRQKEIFRRDGEIISCREAIPLLGHGLRFGRIGDLNDQNLTGWVELPLRETACSAPGGS